MTKEERKDMSNIIFKTSIAMVFAGISIGALLIGLAGLQLELVASLGVIAAIIKFWPMKAEIKYYSDMAKDEEEEEG